MARRVNAPLTINGDTQFAEHQPIEKCSNSHSNAGLLQRMAALGCSVDPVRRKKEGDAMSTPPSHAVETDCSAT